MANQNKLTEAYLPERSARKEKVAIALSGGIDSLVSAYLLKIQKYDLVALTVVPSWDELGKDQDQVLSCAVSEKSLTELQEHCQQMGIPQVLIRITGEFKERVVERWRSRRALGEKADQCWDCHGLRMELLHEKMKEIGATKLATGHFAKVFRGDAEGSCFVQCSNDETHDQSGLLSRLPQEILQDLMLPLSDLQKKETAKLAENFGISGKGASVEMFGCFPESEELTRILAATLPPRFRKEGLICDAEDDRLEDHEGVYAFTRGEEILSEDKSSKLFFGHYVPTEKKIVAVPESWFARTSVFLRECAVPADTPWGRPFRGVLVRDHQAYEGWFFPKSLSSCLVELDAPADLVEGEILTVMRRKGKNARVLLTGSVCYLAEEKEEGEKNAVIDFARDF